MPCSPGEGGLGGLGPGGGHAGGVVVQVHGVASHGLQGRRRRGGGRGSRGPGVVPHGRGSATARSGLSGLRCRVGTCVGVGKLRSALGGLRWRCAVSSGGRGRLGRACLGRAVSPLALGSCVGKLRWDCVVRRCVGVGVPGSAIKVLAQVVTAGTLRSCSDPSVQHFLALLTPDYAAPLKDKARKILASLAEDIGRAVDTRLSSGGPWCIISDGAHSKSHSFVNVGLFVGGWPSRGWAVCVFPASRVAFLSRAESQFQ